MCLTSLVKYDILYLVKCRLAEYVTGALRICNEINFAVSLYFIIHLHLHIKNNL